MWRASKYRVVGGDGSGYLNTRVLWSFYLIQLYDVFLLAVSVVCLLCVQARFVWFGLSMDLSTFRASFPPLPRITPAAPDVTDCLGLSLLSSIVNTLGPASPGGMDGGERGNGGGGGGIFGVLGRG